jgi:glycosyltransferase involved in cell wall biosynthesis
MKVGIDAFALNHPFSGVGQVTTHLLNALRTLEGAEFFLYVTEDCDLAFPPNFHKHVIPLKWNKGLFAKKWWEARQVPAAVRRDRCDVLLSLYQSAAVMPAGFPHVMVVHDIIYVLLPRYRDRLYKRIATGLALRGIRRASRCIAVSHHTKKDMIEHLGMRDDAISVAHIAADPRFAVDLTPDEVDRVLRKYGVVRGYIYHGGGLDERKNAAGVLRAYARLADESYEGSYALPPIVISGAGAGRAQVEELARSLGIADRVVLVGLVPQEELPALYNGAAMFLYPSYYEGFGLPVLEAMHQGVPTVTANTSSLPEVGGDTVLYCDPEDVAGLAQQMRTLLTDRALREKLSRLARKRAASFTWDDMVREIGTATGLMRNRAIKQDSFRDAD